MRSRGREGMGASDAASSGSRSSSRSSTREERHARGSRRGARTRHGPGERQADQRAHGPLRPVRAEGHAGRRGETALRRPAARAEDGQRHAGRRTGAVHAAARPRPCAEGMQISVGRGRFGPYVKYGASMSRSRKTIRTPWSCARALVIVEQRKQADRNRIILDFPDAGIQVLNGRYGPYITDKERNAKISEGSRPGLAHAGGMPGAARCGARAQGAVRPLRAPQGCSDYRRRRDDGASCNRRAAQGGGAQGRKAEGGEAQGRKEKGRREESPRQGRARRRVTHG